MVASPQSPRVLGAPVSAAQRLDSAPALGTLPSEKWDRCFSQDAYAEDPTSTTVPG